MNIRNIRNVGSYDAARRCDAATLLLLLRHDATGTEGTEETEETPVVVVSWLPSLLP